MKYRYAIYFTWNDGFEDAFNVYNAKERDASIKEMIESGDFKYISFCRIYANGEYGRHINIKYGNEIFKISDSNHDICI